MEKIFPDKYIRKAISDLLDGITVNGQVIKCYDVRATGVDINDHYILMSTQTAEVDKNNKCEYFWDSTILLDVFTRYRRQGNTGSRLLVDDIMEAVRELLEDDLTLEGGLEVINQTMSFPNDLNNITPTEMVFRKFLRLSLKIK